LAHFDQIPSFRANITQLVKVTVLKLVVVPGEVTFKDAAMAALTLPISCRDTINSVNFGTVNDNLRALCRGQLMFGIEEGTERSATRFRRRNSKGEALDRGQACRSSDE
jgi:hypothetical protein